MCARDLLYALIQDPAVCEVDAGDTVFFHQALQSPLDRLRGLGIGRGRKPPGGNALQAVRCLGVLPEVMEDALAKEARIGKGGLAHSAPMDLA